MQHKTLFSYNLPYLESIFNCLLLRNRSKTQNNANKILNICKYNHNYPNL